MRGSSISMPRTACASVEPSSTITTSSSTSTWRSASRADCSRKPRRFLVGMMTLTAGRGSAATERSATRLRPDGATRTSYCPGRPSPTAPRRPAGRLSVGIRPLEVLQDPPRVVHDLVAVHDHRHAALPGELLDLGAGGAAVGHPLDAMLEPEAAQPPRDRP